MPVLNFDHMFQHCHSEIKPSIFNERKSYFKPV